MKYPLKDLLFIRNSRVEKAEEELAKARRNLEDAIQNQKRKEKELEEYKVWRKEEEDRLFNKIINKKVRKDAVANLRYELSKLKDRELEHEKAVEDAKAQVEEAKEAVEVARGAYQQAVISLEKILEHKKTWVEEWKKEQELIMEREFEEFRAKEAEYNL